MKSWMFLSTIRCPSPILMAWPRFKNILILGGAMLTTLLIMLDPKIKQQSKFLMLDLTTSIHSLCRWPGEQLSQIYGSLQSYRELAAKNKKLQMENQALRTRYHQALALSAENQRLRSKLRVINEMTPEFISVRVLGGSESPYQKNLLLGGGLKAGIQPKSAVLLNHQIIGRITEVGNTSSRVLLVTDPDSHIPVVLEKSGIQGILSGDQSSIMKIKVVEKSFVMPNNDNQPLEEAYSKDQSPQVEEGEYVFSSGLGGIFPPGHLVGRVIKVSPREILVESLIDESRLEYVQVAIPYEDVKFH